MSLCKDPTTTSHLEHYKSKLTKDKNLKELVFHACTAIEKEFHTNASKQPIHKARVIMHNKDKGCAIHCSYATIDTKSDDDENDPDKIMVYSDFNTESIKMVIDEETFRAEKSLKFFKTRSSNVITRDKHKELYKIRVFPHYPCLSH
ncbi:uncharacterized protein BT62DRAFT_920131 [Guyanagaster necrorhizus]|uniref:Uncharacterized protein n=1 Tax=Guyanagaster necrorhizus TaxID=856835 RepID=A0A9P8ASG5_9AGAR|nr:uncharacterized protein BT62DRAFT_920131 [Guyanagaster necrorhizus MCA 3950]KAG7446090.1 hypothetical protein BT62DRAFT_920131 [Guyanagaster necrorhizus MCA 3950]